MAGQKIKNIFNKVNEDVSSLTRINDNEEKGHLRLCNSCTSSKEPIEAFL